MKKGIFAEAWQEAMQKHAVYKKEKLEEMKIAKKELREEVDKRSTGILGGIGLYYLQQVEKIFNKIFKGKRNKK